MADARSTAGGTTGGTASGGASSPGLVAGTSTPRHTAGSSPGAGVPLPVGGLGALRGGGGTSAQALLAGSGAAGASGGESLVVPEGPEGGTSPVGRLLKEVTSHSHLTGGEGGVIDYARLLVSPTAPPAPSSPSDAFWLNPNEVA